VQITERKRENTIVIHVYFTGMHAFNNKFDPISDEGYSRNVSCTL